MGSYKMAKTPHLVPSAERRVHAELRKTSGAEKHFRDQAEVKTSNVARENPLRASNPPHGI